MDKVKEAYIVVPLTTAINLLKEQRFDYSMIGAKIGVTKLQVHYYKTGSTKCPSPIVCKAIFDEFKVDGQSLLIDIYKDYDDLLQHYKQVKAYNAIKNK